MRYFILIISCLLSVVTYGQVVGSVNSGAVNNSDMIFSVGEIFVVPSGNANEANSGLIGAVSRIEFFVTGIENELSSGDIRVFPNPASNSLYIDVTGHAIKSISVYSLAGALVAAYPLTGNSIDLSAIEKGVYILQTDNPQIASFKIVKQ